jgi:hypothetical protein
VAQPLWATRTSASVDLARRLLQEILYRSACTRLSRGTRVADDVDSTSKWRVMASQQMQPEFFLAENNKVSKAILADEQLFYLMNIY